MTVELLRRALVVFVFQIPGGANAIVNAISTRHAWADPARLFLPPTRREAVIGAMSILNARFTKLAQTFTVCAAKLGSA
jgi:hypothetical protein